MSSPVEATTQTGAMVDATVPIVGSTISGATLLPAPDTSLNIDDVLAAVMKLSTEMNEAETKTSLQNIETSSNVKKMRQNERMAALDRAIAAAKEALEKKDSGGLFDDLLENMGPISLAGFIVGSVFMVAADVVAHATELENDNLDLADAGAMGAMLAGPLGAAVYATELFVKKFGPEELQQALDEGPTLKDETVRTANKVALALAQAELALASTVASGGTAAPAIVAMVGIGISTATQVLQETGALKSMFGDDAGYVALGGMLTGAGLTVGASAWTAIRSMGSLQSTKEACEQFNKIANAADKALTTVKSVHAIVQGVHNLEAADLQHDADNLQVIAKGHQQAVEMLASLIDELIDDVRELKESGTRISQISQQLSAERAEQTLALFASFKA